MRAAKNSNERATWPGISPRWWLNLGYQENDNKTPDTVAVAGLLCRYMIHEWIIDKYEVS